jgi:general secretion pathway protein A
VSSYPSMGAGVSLRIRPLARGAVPSENYFAFRENPFSLTPNPRFLHRTRQAHETLSRLTRGILERKGLILLSGEIGTGKTTLLYSALHLMTVNPAVHNKIGTAVIVHPTLTRDEFLEAVLDEFDVECPSARRQWRLEALLNMLLEVRRKGGVAVLVIDEAQLLTADLLEEVKSLLSLQTSHEKLLQIVLCGQPELEGKLEGMSLRQGEPFVTVRCNTVPLSLQDTHDYVQHRLRIAGARSDALFAPESVDAVHLHTNGIPRLINLLCAQALSVAASYKAERVFPYMVDQAAAEICSCALADIPEAPDDPSENGFPTSSMTPLLARSFPTSRVIPVRCEVVEAEAKGELANPEPAKIEHLDAVDPNPGNEISSDVSPMDEDPAGGSEVGANPTEASPFVACAMHSNRVPANPTDAGVVRSNEDTPADALSAVQAARKKRRALRHHAKFARAAKRAHGGGRAVVKCDFRQDSAAAAGGFRPEYRPSPFRRGRVRKARLALSDLREFQKLSIGRIVTSMRSWNRWLNRWCSEHFTSRSCGKPLFQLGLAGTLFLALAQAIVVGFPRQHLAHVAFGFLGLLFIDISLGLGTYLLLIERRQQTTSER